MANSHQREGLRVRFEPGVDSEVRSAILKFISWLRLQTNFPIRVVIYIKKANQIKSMDGQLVSATFLGPWDKNIEPYIRISTGDLEELLAERGVYNAIAAIFNSIAHELVHYQQWLIDPKFKNGEREATSKAKQIVMNYLQHVENTQKDRVMLLNKNITEESLIELLDIFSKSNLRVQDDIIAACSNFTTFIKARSFLIEQTENPDPTISSEALLALSHFQRDHETNNICIRCLGDKNNLVRMRAAEVARDLGDEGIGTYLISSLTDKDELVRGYAAVSLGILGDAEVIPRLEQMLENEKRNATKLRIYVALFYLGQSKYFNLIVHQLKNRSYLVRLATSYYLVELADEENICIINDALLSAIDRETNEEVHISMIKNFNYLKTQYELENRST